MIHINRNYFYLLIILLLLNVDTAKAMLLPKDVAINTTSLNQQNFCEFKEVTFNNFSPLNWQTVFSMQTSDLDEEQIMQANNMEIVFNQIAYLILDNRIKCLNDQLFCKVISFITLERLKFALRIQLNYLQSSGYKKDISHYYQLIDQLDQNTEISSAEFCLMINNFLNCMNSQLLSIPTFISKTKRGLFNGLKESLTSFGTILNFNGLQAIQPLEYAELLQKDAPTQSKHKTSSSSSTSYPSFDFTARKRKASEMEDKKPVSLFKPISTYFAQRASVSTTSAVSASSSGLRAACSTTLCIEPGSSSSMDIASSSQVEEALDEASQKQTYIDAIINSVRKRTFIVASCYQTNYETFLATLGNSDLKALSKLLDFKTSRLNSVYDGTMNNTKLYQFFAENLTKFNAYEIRAVANSLNEPHTEKFKARIKELRKQIAARLDIKIR